MAIGLISGAMGPFSNAPIDTIKTRKFLQQPQPSNENKSLTTFAGIYDKVFKSLPQLKGSRPGLV